ncbi:MAG TPA: ABC transporter ATP-binding protein [Savagea sp.]
MVKRFFTYYKPHRRLFIIDFFSAIVVALLDLAFPIAVKWFIDVLLPEGDWGKITTISILLLFTYVLSTFLNFIVAYFGHKLGTNIETDMREELFGHVQKQSFRFFDNNKTGHIMSRITNDLFEIGELAHHGPEDIFIAIMTIIGASILMFNINAELALIAIIMVPVLAILVSYSNKKMNTAWRNIYGDIAEINSRVEDSVAGSRVVQSFTNETYEMERFRKNNYQFRSAKLRAYKVMAWATSTIFMTTRLSTLVILVVGSWFVFQGNLTNGELVSFVLFTNVLVRPVDKISALLELYPKGMAGFKRFTEMLDEQPDVEDKENALAVDHLSGNIAFHDVSFAYEDGRKVLNRINLTIHAGETVAFVGPSGAGKTTICTLIPRFYDVTEGSITIDNHDLRDLTQQSLRSQIGTVQQDVFLFTGTIRENIAYGNLQATNQEIERAAQQAHLTDMIANLPEGLETQIGERGLKLSGGQKQRLAIARMFLKNPPILILDEATSALDTATEQIIQQSLDELAENRTTLVIAHRLATIRNADRVIVVTENGIEEQGTYEELLENKGLFAHLHEIQFRNV